MKKTIIILVVILLVTGIIVSNCNDNITDEKNILLNTNDSIDLRIKNLELYANETQIDFDFNPDIKSYTIVLPDSRMDVIYFKAELYDDKAYFLKDYFLNEDFEPTYYKCRNDKCIFNFTVTSSIGNEMTYTLEIVRPQGVATNSRLSYLKINNKEVKLSDDLKYLVVLGKNENVVNVETIVDTKDVNALYDEIELVNGENEFVITLVDKQNIKLDYKITILKVDVDNDELLNYEQNNLNIKKLNIDGRDYDFDVNKYNYDIIVDDPTIIPSLKIEPETVKYEQILTGKRKGNKTLVLKVFNDCETKTYNLNFISKTENEEHHNELIGENNIYYYIFFVISFIIFIISICYAIVKKNRRKMVV